MQGFEKIGCARGMIVYASQACIAQHGKENIAREFGCVREWPVRVDLSGNTVMFEAKTQEDAVRKYLSSKAVR